MNSSLFIALRFLRTIHRDRNLASMLIISSFSIMISTFAFALIMAIMNGFQSATLTIIQGIHSDLTIEAPVNSNGVRSFLNFDAINAILTKEFSHSIAHATPIAHQHAIIQKARSPGKKNKRQVAYQDISHVVLIEGISPATELHTRSLLKKIAPAAAQHNDSFALNTVRIGKTLAHELSLSEQEISDKKAFVSLLFADAIAHPDEGLQFEKATVSVEGTFTTGIDDFDQAVIFCSMETFKTLFPDSGINKIGIKLRPAYALKDVQKKLQQRFNLEIVSWQELYPALLDAQKLEQSVMVLILLLVAGMASVTGIALLTMYLVYQQTTLTIFLSMGMRVGQLRTIFTTIALILTALATLGGLVLAAAASWLLETYHLIPLPAVYYIEYVPAHMNMTSIILVLVLMNGVSLITSWLTTGRIKKMNHAHILKNTHH